MIYKCTNSGDIHLNSTKSGKVGCIAGNVRDAEILKCQNTGKVTAEGNCEITENPLDNSLWGRIVLFFISIFERISNLFIFPYDFINLMAVTKMSQPYFLLNIG